MSVSPPSWLFGKILISTRPFVSVRDPVRRLLGADVERMGEREVVAVLQLELGGPGDQGHADDRRGRRGGESPEHGSAGQDGHGFLL